ncbi:uncharacterized protein LOC108089799 isoform X2 [Drosophila ficusphila]|uniref:uncharacterized protein LOC108089799 isoform X2 n=1 Tax=Drosophila ficusphila TaxID=30025 RepID=UPI0007E8AEF1|nr:uncharacterized protein LOC108089799 isoform X2 [Drosophila ficusphila]
MAQTREDGKINGCLEVDKMSPKKNVARVAARLVKEPTGPAAKWLAVTRAIPKPTFPELSGLFYQSEIFTGFEALIDSIRKEVDDLTDEGLSNNFEYLDSQLELLLEMIQRSENAVQAETEALEESQDSQPEPDVEGNLGQ